MKRYLFFLLTAAGFITAAAQSPIEYETDAFEAISVSHAFRVHLTQAETNSVTAEAAAGMAEHLDIGVEDGTLYIRLKDSYTNRDWKLKTGETVVHVRFREIDELELSGAVKASGTNQFNLDDLEVELSGASDLEINLRCDALSLRLSGAGYVQFEVEADEVEIEASGASNVRMKGFTDGLEINSSGASNIEAADLRADDAEVAVSGSGTVEVWADDDLQILASGKSEVRYKCGNCDEVEIAQSGLSSVKKY